MSDEPNISRRGLFEAIFKPLKRIANSAGETIGDITHSQPESTPESPAENEQHTEPSHSHSDQKVAIIQGRFCLAYQRSFCTTCSEHCPEEGAIIIENAIPTVVADACTGCGICHDVCPAPRNAILIIDKNASNKNYGSATYS